MRQQGFCQRRQGIDQTIPARGDVILQQIPGSGLDLVEDIRNVSVVGFELVDNRLERQ